MEPQPEGELGHQAKDGKESIHPSAQARRAMVSRGEARAHRPRTARRVVKEAARALRVLRPHRELEGALAVSSRSHPCLAKVARPPLTAEVDELAAPQSAAGEAPTASSAR